MKASLGDLKECFPTKVILFLFEIGGGGWGGGGIPPAQPSLDKKVTIWQTESRQVM